jgi:WD40 repeat protein
MWLSVVVLASAVQQGRPASEMKEQLRVDLETSRFAAAVSPDGRALAVAVLHDRTCSVQLWDVVARKQTAALRLGDGFPGGLAFSGDGRRLAGAADSGVRVWDVGTRKELARLEGRCDYSSNLAFGPDGTRLAVADPLQEVTVWDVGSGKQVASLPHGISRAGMPNLAFNGKLTTVAAADYQEIDLWDISTSKLRATLSEHRGQVGCLAWSADGKTLVAASCRSEGRDCVFKGDVKLWDPATGKERVEIRGPFGDIQAAALSPDGKILALLDRSDLYAEFELKVVDIASGRRRVMPPVPLFRYVSLLFTRGGKLLVIGTTEEALKLWEAPLP